MLSIIKFLKVFLIVFIKLIIFLTMFCFSVAINVDAIFVIPVILLLLYLILYFIYYKKIAKLLNVNFKVFNIFYFISWLIIEGLITYLLLTDSFLWKILPTGNVIFSGIEYILVPILLSLYFLIALILKIIICIFTYIKNK